MNTINIKEAAKTNGISRMYFVKRWLLDLVYPNRCPFCNEIIPFDEYHCDSCGLFFSPAPEKWKYGFLDGLTAFTVYDTVSRAFISKIKRESNGYAISAAAYMIAKGLINEDHTASLDCITYVPMRRKAVRKRGYNQTKLMAKELSGILGLPYADLLKKNRDTAEQKKLGAEGRKNNVKDAFSFTSKHCDIAGKNILIIDDVTTTGSTLSEIARTLKAAGADKVYAAVFAKTPRK
ncbi:MAG: ComF family protein [Ruminococcaceae bacterium]|nr:ComF family protein [Oscillospiraceae bacterium]